MPVSVLILPGIVVTQCSVGQILKGNECVCDTAAGYRNGASGCVCENDYVNDRGVCFHPVNGTTVDYDREVRTIDVVGQNRSFSASGCRFWLWLCWGWAGECERWFQMASLSCVYHVSGFGPYPNIAGPNVTKFWRLLIYSDQKIFSDRSCAKVVY